MAERIGAAHANGREGQPEEIAAVAAFLLTDDASFMTGSVDSVDGGQTACIPFRLNLNPTRKGINENLPALD